MRAIVTCLRRFQRTPDGRVWTSSIDDYCFFQRYLVAFEEVLVVGRVENVPQERAGNRRADGPGVSILALPNYVGPRGYLASWFRVRKILREGVRPDDAVILRVPSHVSRSVESVLRHRRQPYALEVVGNPHATFAPGTIDHPLRPFLRWNGCRNLRRMCRNASAVSYVTERTLQTLFPPSPDAYSTHYSSAELPDESIAVQPRTDFDHGRCVTLISVGSMELSYKGFDVLIEAVKQCLRDGLDLRLVLVGDGRQRRAFEDLAGDAQHRIVFTGELPGSSSVREELRKADLFVLCSKTEGLPRVIIEAMAVGLPCIGTAIGGTPELLPLDDLVPPGDARALAVKLREVTTNPERMSRMSVRNLQVAEQYADSVLRKRRAAMYQHLRGIIEKNKTSS